MKEIERKEAHAIKENKRWRANMYLEMTSFIVRSLCNEERVHEIFPKVATGCIL